MVWTNFGYYYEKNEDVGCGYRNVVVGEKHGSSSRSFFTLGKNRTIPILLQYINRPIPIPFFLKSPVILSLFRRTSIMSLISPTALISMSGFHSTMTETS
jgi:hypothetical protein